MHLHHDKHHQTYVNNVNAALEKHPKIGEDLESLLVDVESIPADIRQAVINNGGGSFEPRSFLGIDDPEQQLLQQNLQRLIWFIWRLQSSQQLSSNDTFWFWLGKGYC